MECIVHRSLTAFALILGLVLPLQPAAAQVEGAKEITDPALLESMGFPRNAENVYMDDAVSTAASSTPQNADEVLSPQTTPTTGVDQVAISAKEFIGRIDTTGTQWSYQGGPNCCVDLSRTGTERFADAQFSLPTNATLNFFRFWAFDNVAQDLGLFVFEVCQPGFGSGAPTFNTIVSTNTAGTPGHTTGLVSLNVPVDNTSCTYLARVRFDVPSTNLALQKVRLQFTR